MLRLFSPKGTCTRKDLVIAILLIIYVLFVTVDCIRLKKTQTETKPFITISYAEYENGNKYNGLGYSIKYYKDKPIDTDDNIEKNIYGAEFRLFDKILIWAWVE